MTTARVRSSRVASDATAGTNLTLDQVVFGFPGDESVNGSWVLRIVDGTAGGAGTLTSWGMTLGSRWD